MRIYDVKIKKFIKRALETGEVIQVKDTFGSISTFNFLARHNVFLIVKRNRNLLLCNLHECLFMFNSCVIPIRDT
jgi:hypothetical protein